MRRLLVFVLVAATANAQQVADRWHQLLDSHKVDDAEILCTGWAVSAEMVEKVEAQKCLANVALSRGSAMSLLGNDAGGGTLGEGYQPEAIDKALRYLNEGIRLAPQDLSVHQGRLYILEVSGRFDAMAKALDESAAIYKGADALEAWLSHAAELGNMGQARAGLALSEILNHHYPGNHQVIGNIGAFHSMLKEPAAALPYLQKAVELAPGDPIDSWNLGRAYDHLDQNGFAKEWYSKSLAIDSTGADAKERKCLYATFVEKKLHDRALACRLQKASCEDSERTACAARGNELGPAT